MSRLLHGGTTSAAAAALALARRGSKVLQWRGATSLYHYFGVPAACFLLFLLLAA